MAMLRTSTDNQLDRPGASSFFAASSGTAATHVLRHISTKLVLVALFVIACTVIFMASVASNKQPGDPKQSVGASATAQLNTSTQSATNSTPPLTTQQTVQSTTSTSSADGSGPSLHVSVNGQEIPVPESGNVQKTVVTPDGSTLNISSSTQGGASNSSSVSTTMSITNSSSSTSSNVSIFTNGGGTTQGTQ